MHGAVVLEGFPAFHFSFFPQFSFTRMTDVTTNRVTFRHQPGCSHHALGEILALNEHFSRVCRFQSLPPPIRESWWKNCIPHQRDQHNRKMARISFPDCEGNLPSSSFTDRPGGCRLSTYFNVLRWFDGWISLLCCRLLRGLSKCFGFNRF